MELKAYEVERNTGVPYMANVVSIRRILSVLKTFVTGTVRLKLHFRPNIEGFRCLCKENMLDGNSKS